MTAEDPVTAMLEESRRRGFLGPGPVAPHVEHAERALSLLDDVVPVGGLCVDLGSGGGVPGLVLAVRRPTWRWVLLDAQQRRTDFLSSAARRLGLTDRVEVVRDRAEVVGRDPARRESADVVVARSFGAPAVTAECAAPLLVPSGSLVVSEPPDDAGIGDRWPDEGLGALGLARIGLPSQGWVRIRRVGPLDDRFPRPNGRPAKRPLWT